MKEAGLISFTCKVLSQLFKFLASHFFSLSQFPIHFEINKQSNRRTTRHPSIPKQNGPINKMGRPSSCKVTDVQFLVSCMNNTENGKVRVAVHSPLQRASLTTARSTPAKSKMRQACQVSRQCKLDRQDFNMKSYSHSAQEQQAQQDQS